MKCVIVAAGMSTRLRPMTDTLPKCLLTIGAKTILGRTVESLLAMNVTNIALVVGFEAEKIRSFVRQRFPDRKFRFILNPNYASTNNAYSLLLASDFFLDPKARTKAQDHLLLLDSDIVFHPGLLHVLAREGEENRIGVRVNGTHDEEEVGVSIDSAGSIVKIGKYIEPKDTYGESIGMEFFNNETGRILFEVLEKRVKSGNGRTEYYEEAFQEMISMGVKFKATDVDDFPVTEIDSPADLAFAEQTVVPLINTIPDVQVR